jgi:predicted hotdog family 3-hydroxylacyl-ACP dehydratase
MLKEVIWVSGAVADYLSANETLAPSDSIDEAIQLVCLFPDIGARQGRTSIRRVLIGKQRKYALFYAFAGSRLIIVALLDLRQGPVAIEATIRIRSLQDYTP